VEGSPSGESRGGGVACLPWVQETVVSLYETKKFLFVERKFLGENSPGAKGKKMSRMKKKKQKKSNRRGGLVTTKKKGGGIPPPLERRKKFQKETFPPRKGRKKNPEKRGKGSMGRETT